MQLNIIIVLCMITIMESTWFGIYCDRAFQFSLRGRGKTHKLFTPKSEGLLISFTEMDLKKEKNRNSNFLLSCIWLRLVNRKTKNK